MSNTVNPAVVEMPDDTRRAIEALDALAEAEIPKLPELLFRQHLLPLLVNTDSEVDLRLWQNIAGTVVRPIDVVDSVGMVLFRVPALIRSPPSAIAGSAQGHTYGDIITTAKQKHEQHPRVGEVYLDHALSSKLKTYEPQLDDIRQWNKIRAHYNLPLLPAGGAPTEEVQDATSSPSSIFTGEDDVA